MNISVSVQRNFEHKEIDTRWIQVKIGNGFRTRSSPASCIQAGDIYIHGGCNRQDGVLEDMYSAKIHDLPTKWVSMPQKGKKPGPLRNHTLLAYTSYLVLYGGQKNMMENNNCVYIYDLRTCIWSESTCLNSDGEKQSMPALDSHSLFVHNNQAYILFGYDSNAADLSSVILVMDLKQVADNIIVWKSITINSKLGKVPILRTGSAGCVFHNEIFVFGGGTQLGTLNDMWVFDIKSHKWEEILPQKQHQFWPLVNNFQCQKRKGHCLVAHANSGNFFMFGGLKEITKEQNDVCIFLRERRKWVEIHSNTNDLYDPSPLIKKQIQDSPTILDAKRKRKSKGRTNQSSGFRLSIKSTTSYDDMHRANSTATNLNLKRTTVKTELQSNPYPFDRKMSVVQEKKYREFMSRKKKLLGEISKGYCQPKRSHSPTSEALLYSIGTIGQQNTEHEKQKQAFEVPKVIFDERKGVVIGKKPCARDGHVGLANEDTMIVIGGDRHMVSFNDCYIFKMDKAMQSMHCYL